MSEMSKKGYIEFWSDWGKGFFIGIIIGVILLLVAQYYGYVPSISPPSGGGGQGTQASIGLLAFALRSGR